MANGVAGLAVNPKKLLLVLYWKGKRYEKVNNNLYSSSVGLEVIDDHSSG
jgi:hypothetical protein